MPSPADIPRSARWSSVLWLTLAVTAFRLLYLRLWCPYTLVEDEAHYWEWSRRLEWSYYSKGPGVAWAIAASDWLCQWLGLGLSEFTVRLPSVLMAAALTIGIAGLARAATGDRRAGFYAAALSLLAPGFQFGSLLMTIDVPYAACWALAAWSGWRALRGGGVGSWLGLGSALALGVLFKYTILLLIPGLALWALLDRSRLRLAPRWPAMLAASIAVFSLGLAPIIIWNAQNGWATIHHLLGHLGLAGGDTVSVERTGWHYDPRWTLMLIGSQFPLTGPTLIVAILAAIRSRRVAAADPEHAPGRSYLLWCAAPIFVFYIFVTFLTEPEGNWPLAGHVTLFCLGGWGAAAEIDDWKARVGAWRALAVRPWQGIITPRPETLGHLAWRLSVLVGVIVGLGTLRADWVAASRPMRLLESVSKGLHIVREDRPMIPLGRLMGADRMAADAAKLAGEVRAQTGKDPFIIAEQYGRASLLAFYMPGRPIVYCSSSRSGAGGRKTQYDLWAETSLDKPDLKSRPAILVGGKIEYWAPAFRQVRVCPRPGGMLDGETKKDRLTFIGVGYRGFPALPASRGPKPRGWP